VSKANRRTRRAAQRAERIHQRRTNLSQAVIQEINAIGLEYYHHRKSGGRPRRIALSEQAIREMNAFFAANSALMGRLGAKPAWTSDPGRLVSSWLGNLLDFFYELGEAGLEMPTTFAEFVKMHKTFPIDRAAKRSTG
jgi:hypothetical protein